MRDHKLKIYYGDADADIAAADELNIRGIRILRANSSYQPLPKQVSLVKKWLSIQSTNLYPLFTFICKA